MSDASTNDRALPTVVLVHGAWADATGFDAEIRALQREGFRAIGFANPLRDLDGDAAYLAEFLQTVTGPIVLVGHSYGGNVISVAAAGNEQVQALVFFNGWMCDEGESQQQLLERFEGSLVGPSIRPVPFTNPDGSEGTDLFLDSEAFPEAFAADVDPETAAVMAAAQRPLRRAALAAAPSGPLAWKTLPCWYLLGTEDKAIRRRSSGSWPSARMRRSWRCRPHTLVRVPARSRDPADPSGRRGDVRSAAVAGDPAVRRPWPASTRLSVGRRVRPGSRGCLCCCRGCCCCGSRPDSASSSFRGTDTSPCMTRARPLAGPGGATRGDRR